MGRNVRRIVMAALLAVSPVGHAGMFGISLDANRSLEPRAHSTGKSLKARATTDISDLWWNPAESGWGMQLVQNNNFVFATLFVYGPSGAPTWFTAQLQNVGNFTWTGPLYATTGPWFAAFAFNPGQVTVRQAGTLTFHATDIANGTVSYTADGQTVNKVVTRQTLVNEPIAGVYDVILTQSQTCIPPIASGTGTARTSLSITQSGSTVIGQTSSAPGQGCTLTGTYTQYGKMGSVAGNFSCTWGEVGSFSIFEIMITETGMLARVTEQSNFCSSITASIGGLRQ